MIPVYRFSIDGFSPKVQTYHFALYQCYTRPFKSLSICNEWQNKLMQESHFKASEQVKNLNFYDWIEGVWVFVGQFPDFSTGNLQLNHLNLGEKQKREWYCGEIDSFSEIYLTGSLIPKKMVAEEFVRFIGKGQAAYIPKRIKIFNKMKHPENV